MDSKKFTIIVAALTMVFCLLTVVYNFASVPAYGEGAAEAVPIYLPAAPSVQNQSEVSSKQESSSAVTSSAKAPSQGASDSKTSSVTKSSSSQAFSGPVNINTAGIEELMNVKYIKETRAQAIIDYRNTHGKFKSIDDLDNVKGFSKTMIDKIKEYITV